MPNELPLYVKLMPSLRKFFIALLIFLLVPAAPGWAKPTTDKQASQVVARWLSLDQTPLGARLGQQVREVQVFKDGSGSPQYYVVYLNPAGFVIVSADDLVEPIIAFVGGGTYDPSTANPLGALVSRDVPGRLAEAKTMMAAAQAQGQEFAPSGSHQEALKKWDFLQGAEPAMALPPEAMSASISDVRVPSLIQAKWSQNKVDDLNDKSAHCYDYYTHWLNAQEEDIYYPCGCVATAMAETMRFFNCPQAGVGTGSFKIKVQGVQVSEKLMGGDGSGGTYDWNNMVYDPKTGASDAQLQAIGRLTHDAGVAIGMIYTVDLSTAFMVDAANALETTFKYNSVKFGQSSWNLPPSNLYNMVNPNLDAGLPVLFGIAGIINQSGGHAVVCDGYGYNAYSLYHHISMGWGGSEDAWYNLPTIDTKANGTYTTISECIYNIYKEGTGEIISGRVVDSKRISPIAGIPVTATRSADGTQYSTTTNNRGIYCFTNLPSASSYTIKASVPPRVENTTQKIDLGTSTDGSITCGNQWGVDIALTRKTNVPAVNLLLE